MKVGIPHPTGIGLVLNLFAFVVALSLPLAWAQAPSHFQVGEKQNPPTEASWDAELKLSSPSGTALGSLGEIHIIDTTSGTSTSATKPIQATAIAATVGIGTGALSYALWVILHEGAHAVAVEAAGGNVTHFDITPDRMEGGGIRFAATYYEYLEGDITQNEAGWIDIAPNITGLTLGTVGSALWLADALPKSRLARMAFASFQIGASINGGIVGVWSNHPDVDIPKAIQAFELNATQARLFRVALTTGAVLNLIPAFDSIIYGLTGKSILTRLKAQPEGTELTLHPILLPNSIGIGAEF